ncbi:MAG TPA: hypothetical protein VH143_31260 [Kofleriaceae bacterium]|jgi:hypothetical protein|nr:hypothetical protein [Kofleriaceae bacterium]
MLEIAPHLLGSVVGGETFGQVAAAVKPALDVPLGQTFAATTSFIRDHAFFHEGVMNLPIGGGKHFRNVPFVGPGRIVKGIAAGNGDEIRKGVEVTRASWDAP